MSLVVAVNGKIQDYIHPQNRGPKRILKGDIVDDFSHEPHFKVKNEFKDNNKKGGHLDKIGSYEKVKKGVPRKRKNIFARDIMTKTVISISSADPLTKAAEIMNKYSFHHLPVVDDKTLMGIISDRDILEVKGSPKFNQQLVKDICHKEVIAARDMTDIKLLTQIMLEEKISSLPIIDDNNEMVGIITKTDILVCVTKNMPLELYI